MDIFRLQIKDKLTLLSDSSKLLFAILTSEKLYPNYVFFHRKFRWGNPDVLNNTLTELYHLFYRPLSKDANEIQSMINDVEKETPDTEDFSDITTSFALDACTALNSTLSFLLDNDINHIVDVATYARDTVDMFVQEKDNLEFGDPDFEGKIQQDIFMIREMDRQFTLLSKLKELNDKDLDDGLIRNLKGSLGIVDFTLIR